MGRGLRQLFRMLPYGASMDLVRDLLASQGYGSGGDLRSSGEMRVFDWVTTNRPVLFDVGGFRGDYTAAFLDRFPDGLALAFEPSAEHFAQMDKHLARYRLARLFNVGLGRQSGPATLYKPSTISGLASLTARDVAPFTITETVQLTTIDDVAAREQINAIDLLKIDVEGHELDVLNGAERMLRSGNIRLIQFEFGGANVATRTYLHDFWDLLTPLGYELNLVQPGGLRPLRKYRESTELFVVTNYVARLKNLGHRHGN